MKLVDILPPVIYRRLKKERIPPLPPVFTSYDEAARSCGLYDDNEIVEIVAGKTKQLRGNPAFILDGRQPVQNLLVFQRLMSEMSSMEVIEPGGACGAMYFQLNNSFPERIKKWMVVETAKMSEAGNKFFSDEHLSFTSSFEDAVKKISGKDLCIASGVIQYMPDPLQLLDRIFNSGFTYLYITRQPVLVGSAAPIITFQETNLLDHGPGSLNEKKANKRKRTPITYIPEDHFNDKITTHGYSVVYNFEESPPVAVKFSSCTAHIKTIGFLLKMKK